MSERDKETQKLQNMGFNDFKTEMGEFGIHNNLSIEQHKV